jgi:predicted nucleotidyltransferase
MSHFDVGARTILLVKSGSHAYGLATPTSDLDFKGVCIEPKRCHFGFVQSFEQQERLANKGHDADSVVYSLKKFARLATECNPNVIEVLFGDEDGIVEVDDFGWQLLENRDLFLSKKARWTFAGYAHSQVKRIETHRRWLLDPPTHRPTRAEFELPENPVIPTGQLQTAQALVQKHLDRWQFNDMSQIDPSIRTMIQNTLAELLAEAKVCADERYRAGCRYLGFDENFLEMLSRERRYKQASDEWASYQRWRESRNEKRAEGEQKHGYDLKHGSHMLRLMRMCKEILSGQGVIVRRPDAEELLAIKLHGAMRYEDLLAEANRLESECEALYETSTLPHHPDRNLIDELVVDMTERYLALHG